MDRPHNSDERATDTYCHRNGDSNCNTDGDRIRQCHPDCYGDGDRDSHCDGHRNSDSHAHGDSHGDCNSDCDGDSCRDAVSQSLVA